MPYILIKITLSSDEVKGWWLQTNVGRAQARKAGNLQE